MADEDLTLRMRVQGALAAQRDVDRVGKSVRNVGKRGRTSSADVNVFTRAIILMQTRAIIATFIVGALAVAIGAVAPAAVLATGALLAMGAVLAPTILLGIGVAQRFADTAGVAGSAASELTDVLSSLKSVWNTAVSPGAAIVMRGMSDALIKLMPLVAAMEGPLTVFATALAEGMGIAADALVAMGPDLIQLFTEVSTLVEPLTHLFMAWAQAFVDGAIAGMPAALKIIGWLTDLAYLVQDGIVWFDKFARSELAANAVATAFWFVATAATYVWGVLVDLAGIAYTLWEYFGDLGLVVAALGFGALAATLGFLNDHLDTMLSVLGPMIVGWIAFKAAVVAWRIVATVAWFLTGGWATTFWALNAAMYANPIGVVIGLVIAVGAAIYMAYQKSETFRSVVHAVWDALKSAWQWIKDNWQTLGLILLGPFAPFVLVVKEVIQHLDTIKSMMSDVGGFLGGVGNALLPGNPFGGDDGPRKGSKARGGLVSRSGAYDVGERGKERVWLPGGSVVEPHGGFDDKELWIAATFVMPDGTVVAKQVVKASRKAKAAR